MKESITKFDLEAAFKALDEIEAPKAGKVKANRPALTEIFSRKTKFDALLEEYYDVNDMTDLDSAKEAREAEVAQAKLARIEKIVDLEAESPEDLLPSYVGKFIMQCPQCMTLFYKDPEDVEASEEDPNTVNVNEVCQHCGNEAGYTLIGKVGEATQEEAADFMGEETVDVTSSEEGENFDELTPDEVGEDVALDEIDLDDVEDLELDLDLDDEAVEEEEEEAKEESFASGSGEQILTEQLNEEAELDVSADEFEELINSPEFKKPISDNEVRTMMNDDSEESEESEPVAEAVEDYESDYLSDSIYDVFNSGKFIHTRWSNNTPPVVKQLSQDTYRVAHAKDTSSYIDVKFDLANKKDSTLKFTIGNKSFSTKAFDEAQDIIINELRIVYMRQFGFDLNESITVNNEKLCYAVINPDGTYAGVPCTSIDEARDLAAQKEGRVIVALGEMTEALEEGIFDKLKSRASKAEFVLKNALKDYNDIKTNTAGELVPDENNQRFGAFVVIGYTNKYSNGKTITMAPSFNNKDLVVGKNGVQTKTSYKDAENIAKGWSMTQGNGPAFIYLAKSAEDPNAVFMCEYFKGELANDQLEKYYNVVKDHLKGAKLMNV